MSIGTRGCGAHLPRGSGLAAGDTTRPSWRGRASAGQCLIAANAVVPANTEAPDRSFLVGVPGRVKGPVSEAQLAMMRYTNESVAEEGRLYKAEGLGHELD